MGKCIFALAEFSASAAGAIGKMLILENCIVEAIGENGSGGGGGGGGGGGAVGKPIQTAASLSRRNAAIARLLGYLFISEGHLEKKELNKKIYIEI